MIGNDVVDLKLAACESDWRRRGFLPKLFSASEIDLILASENPDSSIWDLWSRKEAAYKIFNRLTGIRSFNPLYFSCADIKPESNVVFGDRIVFSRTESTSEFIHTVCVSDEKFFGRVAEVARSQIFKQNGLPFHVSDSNKNPATVSHHGNFLKCVGLTGDGFDFDFACQRAVNGTFLGNF